MKEEIEDKLQVKYRKLYRREELNLLKYESVIEANQFQYVYEPNDDTFLLLSTLIQEIKEFPQDVILCEVGSGSGIISANVNHWMIEKAKKPILHLSIDINMDASNLSSKYYQYYGLQIQQINTSLFNNLVFSQGNSTLCPQIIIFNPPYVPVEQQQLDNEQKYLVKKLKFVRENKRVIRQKSQNMIAYSYMGGLDGLAITRKILNRLKWNCVFYFIVMGEQGLESITKQIEQGSVLSKQHHFQRNLTVMQYSQFYNEHLYVLKLHLKVINN